MSWGSRALRMRAVRGFFALLKLTSQSNNITQSIFGYVHFAQHGGYGFLCLRMIGVKNAEKFWGEGLALLSIRTHQA